MKTLIAVLSCELYRTNGNNQAMHDTWLPLVRDAGADYRIFMGNGSTCSQPDEVFLAVPDDYLHVTYKARAMYSWALANGYDYIFKCFPDTYVNPGRLMRSGFENYDYVGNFACTPAVGPAYCTGGAGYWLSRRAYEKLVGTSIPTDIIVDVPQDRRPLRTGRAPTRPILPPTKKLVTNILSWAEDKFTGETLYKHADIKMHHDLRYEEKVLGQGPEQGNDTITIHLSRTTYVEGVAANYNPSWLYDKHNAWLNSPVKLLNTSLPKIAVITPTVPSRSMLLAECKSLVSAQTYAGELYHAVEQDVANEGPSAMRNKIVQKLDPAFEWIAFCDDDDKLMPEHIETLAQHSNGADVVYSNFSAEGFTPSWTVRDFNYEAVKEANYIPVTVLMRRS